MMFLTLRSVVISDIQLVLGMWSLVWRLSYTSLHIL